MSDENEVKRDKQERLRQSVTGILTWKRRFQQRAEKVYWIGFVPIWIGGVCWSIPRVTPHVWWKWLLCIPADALCTAMLYTPCYVVLQYIRLHVADFLPPLSSQRAVVIDLLSETNDCADVPTLLDVLQLEDELDPRAGRDSKRLRELTEAALVRLLPHLDEETAFGLSESGRAWLFRLLEDHSEFLMPIQDGGGLRRGVPYSPLDVPMTLALLKAYMVVGDDRALFRISLLANLDWQATEDSRRIKQAASECEPVLRANVAAREARLSLLRMSGGPAVAQDQLLRVPTEQEDARAQSLLRSSDGADVD